MHKILFVFGTRPEAIKLCPVVLHFRRRPDVFDVRVCVTAQHRSMLDQVLAAFAVKADYDLDIMQPAQTLAQSSARIIAALEPVVESERPHLVLVQGDTTTTLCAALVAFYKQTPVGHVEAGLRTGDPQHPFPEEMNRVLTTRIADLHFAATEMAGKNLRKEGVPRSRIWVTGNPGIDALLHVKEGLENGSLQSTAGRELDPRKKLILVTAHRRESFGADLENICGALAILSRRKDVQIVYSVHHNPSVWGPVNRALANVENVLLAPPLDYVSFIDLMRRAYLVVSDSGGVQEEAPSLGKPVIVLRSKTERPEAVEAFSSHITGTDPGEIVRAAERLLEEPDEYRKRAVVHNIYGDGFSSRRIADATNSFLDSPANAPSTRTSVTMDLRPALGSHSN